MTEGQVATAVRHLLSEDQAWLVPVAVDRLVVEAGRELLRIKNRCRRALSDLPREKGLAVVLLLGETGPSRVGRWLLLPAQLRAIARGVGSGGGTVVGRYAVYPDLAKSTIAYTLGSPAQQYSEAYLIARPSMTLLSRAIRFLISRWSGCDPSVGAIILVAQKP